MAVRGPKPKPKHLHVVDGTFNVTRHGPRDAVGDPENDGPPVKPRYLKGRASKLWDEAVGVFWWLDVGDGYKLGLWCSLQSEFEDAPEKMVASRIGQLRALGSELGVDRSSRERLGVKNGGPKKKTENPDDPSSFFN
jgi:hypothetical protein